jgi:hypothetical protein
MMAIRVDAAGNGGASKGGDGRRKMLEGGSTMKLIPSMKPVGRHNINVKKIKM